jgi:tetratricopeptide (TPR) repeat protein
VEKYQKLLARTQAEEALARGQKLRQAGRVKNLEDAQAAVAESLGFDQLDEAIKARDELVTELRRARFAADGEARMVEGQDAVTAGKFPQAAAAFKAAVEAFTQAIAVTDGNDMQDRLAEAKVRIEMTAAAAARQEQKWEDALAAYERVRQVRPDDPNFVQMADQGNTMVAREREFFKQYNEGLSALEARQYSKAINRLGRAVEIAKELDVPHEQAAAKHLEAMYLWDMDKGEQARTSGDLVTALAHFRQAQKRMDTPDVREKIAVVEAALKKD